MGTLGKSDCIGFRVFPTNHLVGMINYSTCPEVSLGILSNEPVELILLGYGVQGDWHHVHPPAVCLGIILCEGGATKLPGHNILWIIGRVIWSSRAGAICY